MSRASLTPRHRKAPLEPGPIKWRVERIEPSHLGYRRHDSAPLYANTQYRNRRKLISGSGKGAEFIPRRGFNRFIFCLDANLAIVSIMQMLRRGITEEMIDERRGRGGAFLMFYLAFFFLR